MNSAGGGWRGHDHRQGQQQPGWTRAKDGRGGGRHHTGQRTRPTGSLGASERRGEASKRAGEPPGAVALEKGLLLGLHTIITTSLALAATTSMPSRLAVVVERARLML